MAQAEHRPGFVTVDEYLKLQRDRATWLLKPLIPIGGAALLYGSPKLGKSYLGIQISIALSGMADNWLGFPVVRSGRVLYLQLDTPRSTWAERFERMITVGGLKYNSNLRLADRSSIEHYPFDILQPQHMAYLKTLVRMHDPIAVIIDTLREAHSGEEDNSTVSRNVIANLVGATEPAALILISHARKAHPDMDRSLMDDHRGSSFISGRMDAIMRLTKTRLFYTGRDIEEGDIKMERLDNGLWTPVVDEEGPHVERILADTTLNSMRAKARSLAPVIHKSEEATMSLLRRRVAATKMVINQETGEEVAP